MLPKKERLSREAFNRFFSLGKKKHHPSLLLVTHPYTTLHVSVVVSKKIESQAVKRNVIRRRIYDIVRRYRDEHGLTGVYIVIVKEGVKKHTRETLKDELYKVLAHA